MGYVLAAPLFFATRVAQAEAAVATVRVVSSLSTNVSRRDYTIAGCGDEAMVVLALGLCRRRRWRILPFRKKGGGMQEPVLIKIPARPVLGKN